MPETISLDQIRAAAQYLANRRNDTQACSTMLNAEIKAAIAPILEKYRTTLDDYAESEAFALRKLDDLLIIAPNLFVKPRSLEVDGVKVGYIKDADSLDWDDDAAVIAGIKALLPEQADILIRTEESLNISALAGCELNDLRKVGIRTVAGADRRYIKVGDNDVEKITKLVIADAARRQGENETAKATKGKAKAKPVEVAA
jgi:hypothetical protein